MALNLSQKRFPDYNNNKQLINNIISAFKLKQLLTGVFLITTKMLTLLSTFYLFFLS